MSLAVLEVVNRIYKVRDVYNHHIACVDMVRARLLGSATTLSTTTARHLLEGVLEMPNKSS